jgi:formyltetrahydrofolate-dependent phosphoribosylglycinamide formyltransferase
VSRKRLGILISGRGSNMVALLDAAMAVACPFEPVIVISNRPDAGGLGRAAIHGVPASVIDHRIYGKDREAFEFAVDAELKAAGVELVALAGFMRVLTPWFVNAWAGRLINIHPSLLPRYPGVDTHQRCLDAGDKVHGCTVHQVTAGVDEGPIVGTAEVDVLAGDTSQTLAARVLMAEHLLYPRCLAAVARKSGPRVREDITIDGVTVRLNAPRG